MRILMGGRAISAINLIKKPSKISTILEGFPIFYFKTLTFLVKIAFWARKATK